MGGFWSGNWASTTAVLHPPYGLRWRRSGTCAPSRIVRPPFFVHRGSRTHRRTDHRRGGVRLGRAVVVGGLGVDLHRRCSRLCGTVRLRSQPRPVGGRYCSRVAVADRVPRAADLHVARAGLRAHGIHRFDGDDVCRGRRRGDILVAFYGPCHRLWPVCLSAEVARAVGIADLRAARICHDVGRATDPDSRLVGQQHVRPGAGARLVDRPASVLLRGVGDTRVDSATAARLSLLLSAVRVGPHRLDRDRGRWI